MKTRVEELVKSLSISQRNQLRLALIENLKELRRELGIRTLVSVPYALPSAADDGSCKPRIRE